MPVYTYHCDNCGVTFEKNQRFTDAPLSWCPECEKKSLRKVYTPVGIVFKGSGFYATDHRSPSGAPRVKESESKSSETSASSESTSTTSTSSESKSSVSSSTPAAPAAPASPAKS